MNDNVTIDDSQVQDLFKRLDSKDQKKAMKSALRKAASILVKKTKSNLKQVVRNTNVPSGKYKKVLQKGIQSKVAKDANEAEVHIMGDFRLKFFEKGTQQRVTKGYKITGYDGKNLVREGKGSNKGKIEAKYFFKKAQDETEKQIFSNLTNLLTISINNIASKKL